MTWLIVILSCLLAMLALRAFIEYMLHVPGRDEPKGLAASLHCDPRK